MQKPCGASFRKSHSASGAQSCYGPGLNRCEQAARLSSRHVCQPQFSNAIKSLPRLASAAFGLLDKCGFAGAEPLKIDCFGWVAREIVVQKGWFKEAGVEVEFLWFDYVPSMDAYVARKVDGDALVTASSTHQRTNCRRCSPRKQWMPSLRNSRTLGKCLT